MKKELVIQPIEQSGLPGLPKFRAEVDGLPEGHVVANPELEGGEEELEAIQVGDEKFKLPSGGSTSGLRLFKHVLSSENYEIHIVNASSSAYSAPSDILSDNTIIRMHAVKKDISLDCPLLKTASTTSLSAIVFAGETTSIAELAFADFGEDSVTEILNPSTAKKSVRK